MAMKKLSDRNLRWWGWGLESVSFDFENRSDLFHFLEEKVNRPTVTTSPLETVAINIPRSQIDNYNLEGLQSIFGKDHVYIDHKERLFHTLGTSYHDLL